MKRALSFILSLCVIITLVPTTFAATSSHSIIYSFGNDYKTQQGQHDSGDLLETYTYEKTNDHFAYYSTNAQSAISDNKFQGYYLQLLAENRTIIDGSANGVGSWYAFELNVPAGTYSTEIVYGTRTSGAVEEIYLLDAAEMTDVENNFTPQNLLAEIDINAASASNWKTKTANELVIPTSGKYYLIVRAKDVTNGRYMSIRQLRATTRTNTTEVPYAVSAVAEDTVTVNGRANVLATVKTSYFDSSSVYVVKNYDNTSTDITFAYSSNNTTVATVSDAGVITGLKPGSAEITVSATLNGVSVTDTIDVAVAMADPSGYNAKYDFYTDVGYDFNIGNITYNDTKNTFKYHSRKSDWNPVHDNFRVMGGTYTALMAYHDNAGQWYALELNIPASGEYEAKLGYTKRVGGTNADLYLLAETEAADIEAHIKGATPITSIACSETTTCKAETDSFYLDFENAGKYVLVVYPESKGYTPLRYLTLNGGSGTAYMGATAKADKNELTVGDTATIDASGYMSDRTAVGTVSDWTSSDSTVATVEDGIVTAHSTGTVDITANVTYSQEKASVKVTFIVSDIAAEKSVKVAIDDDGDGIATVTDAILGADVTATAKVPDGKVFRGWVRGSAEKGRLIETVNPYTFKAMTSTYLTAIYVDAPDAETTEYYNWNGEFLGNEEPNDEKAPTLIGYVFAKTWKDAGKVDLISRKIAEFNKETTEYSVAKGENESFSMTSADYKYDTEVTCDAGKEVYWYRDGKLVDFGAKYTFFIWDTTEITTSDRGHNHAKIMLDKKKDKSWMIEYDAGATGKDNILEVGIVFGNDGSTPTVEVCEEKMSSQRKDFTHGQFAATSEYSVARGYLIYNDNGTYRVIYAD